MNFYEYTQKLREQSLHIWKSFNALNMKKEFDEFVPSKIEYSKWKNHNNYLPLGYYDWDYKKERNLIKPTVPSLKQPKGKNYFVYLLDEENLRYVYRIKNGNKSKNVYFVQNNTIVNFYYDVFPIVLSIVSFEKFDTRERYITISEFGERIEKRTTTIEDFVFNLVECDCFIDTLKLMEYKFGSLYEKEIIYKYIRKIESIKISIKNSGMNISDKNFNFYLEQLTKGGFNQYED